METFAKSDITLKSIMMSHRGIINVMFPKSVSKPGKSAMREPERQIKTMDFDVEKNDYSVPEFYEHFGKELPQVIMISQGFFGDIVEDTFDRENIIRIQTVSKQRRVVARADMGDHSKLISIPLTYSVKVCVVKKHKLSTEKTIKEVIEHQSLPCTVEFPRDRTISVDGQNISTNHIPKFQLQKAFDEMYLLGNLIVDGVMRPDVVNVPLYLSQLRMARVIGLKNTPTQNWRGYLEELERFSSYLKYDKEYGNQGIAQYDPSAVHSDAVYAFVEPQTYSNIISVFQHRRGNDGDNTNYLLPKVPPPVPIKPQRPPPPIPEMPGRPKLPARQSRPPSQTPSPTVKHEVIYTNNLPRAPIRPFQPELKEAIEIVQGKIGVHEPKRLVKTMDFDVEKNDYSVPEFYERFGKELPQVIMISQGFFGDIVEDTFDREMIIRIQTVSKQRRVVARADMGDHSKLISIPLTYPETVCVVKKHKLSSEKTIKEAIEHQSLPCVVEFPKHRTISVGGQNISTNQIPKLQLQKAFDEMYLLGNFIVDGVMGPDVVNVPLYLSQLRMVRVIGLKNAPPQKWRGYLEELKRFSSYLRYDNEYGNQGIAQYDPSAVHSDAVYSFVEPQTYSNIISVFQHRLWNVVDNPNYQLTDVNQHEDTKYEEIGMERDSAMHIDKIDNHRPSLSTFGVCRIPAQASTSQISQEVKSTIGSLKSTGSENRSFQESNYSPLIDRNTKVSPPVAIKPPRPPPQIPEIQGSPELPARQPRPPSQMLSPTVKHDAIYTNDVPRTSIRPFQPELKEAIECKQEHSIEYDKQRNTLQSPNRPDLVDKPLPTINDSLDVNKLSINDVCGYLKVLSLDKYEPKFRQEMIDGALMAALSKEDFEKEFGMNGLEAVRIFKFSKEGHLPR
ncbi:uncharacterized protein LOC127858342 isoform X2 [Dreissena polymorpha]|uniref:uncharacterized protein LOC127858342 isoform X2 n=1 Tax=Dreissena polymorpha TaxID=45954 RepID=UPI002264FCF1|nr:uncharacterized protein LOC127858342 isoform X2 [Dreissena polymorpha]